MKKLLIGTGAALAGAIAMLSITAARFESKVRPNTYVGHVSLGGLTADEAARKLRIWWETEKRNPVKLVAASERKVVGEFTPTMLSVGLDDTATVASLPMQEFSDAVIASVTQEESPVQKFEPIYKTLDVDLTAISARIKNALGDPRPARAVWSNGAVIRQAEVASFELDDKALPDAVIQALSSDNREVVAPLREAPKRVPDEELAKVTEVVSSFTTKFPTYKATRCWNIKLASSKFDGMILMPGETVSFNDIVGRRTSKAGYKLAGVYINGRQDTGIGGGICQVSTTLYNAALIGNFTVRKRANHSLPVPYVPLGRDAAVDYNSIDLVIENSYDSPVAIQASYAPGALTFRILGKKDPSLAVKIVQSDRTYAAAPTKTIEDPTLKVGAKTVIEPGSSRQTIRTFRLVYRNGVLVSREPLGRSVYGGKPRIVKVGTAPATPPPAVSPEPLGGFESAGTDSLR